MNKYMELAIKEAQKGIFLGHGGPYKTKKRTTSVRFC